MLNILPSTPSPCPPSPVSHRPPSSVRKRGGQPSNRNAFQHGFYSRKHPTPYAKLSNSMDCYRLIMAEGSPKDFVRAIRDLGKQMDLLLRLVQTVADAGNTPLVLALSKLGLKVTRTSRRLKIMLHRYLQPARDLQYVADHALELIYYDFWDHRITRDADSFRIEFKKSDLNSISSLQNLFPPFMEPDFPFLTSRQWQVLVPLIPPLISSPSTSCSPLPMCSSLGEGSGVRRGVGRPPADPGLLLSAIIWKIAYHARWQELPVGYPSMFTCRRTYRRLFRSGRLFTLYRVLYKDLCTRGRLDLPALVKKDCFIISGKRVALRPGLNETWRMRTTLLFLQPAYQVLRHLQSEIEQARRRRWAKYRLPRLPSLNRRPKPSDTLYKVRPLRPEPEFKFTAPDEHFLSHKFPK